MGPFGVGLSPVAFVCLWDFNYSPKSAWFWFGLFIAAFFTSGFFAYSVEYAKTVRALAML